MPTMIDQLPGSLGVEQTLRTMMGLVNGAVTDPLIRRQAVQATAHCARSDKRCLCASLLGYVKRRLHFVPDPTGVEALHDPRLIAKSLEEKKQVYGDCDDYSMYLAALLKSIGLNPSFRAVGYEGKPYQHVYVTCEGMKLDATRDEWAMPLGQGLMRETSGMNLDVGTGHLQLGGFDLGKMFSRMVKITPKSFSLKNVSGAVGSAMANIATFGLASGLAPKQFGAHGSGAKIIGAFATGGGILPSIMPKAWGLKEHEANWVRGITAGAAAAIGATVAGPKLMSLLGPKFKAAATKLGPKVGEGILNKASSGLLQAIMPMSPAQQVAVAEQVTPDQLAQWELTGGIPPSLLPLLFSGAARSAPPMQYSSSGMPMSMTPEYLTEGSMMTPAQADLFGGMTPAVLIFLGVSAVVALSYGSPSPARRR